ncbi:MAG: ABC transporter substrate-binding protein [Pseudomonadota bacterium]
MRATDPSRRHVIAGLGAGAALSTAVASVPFVQAHSARPIRIGLQKHATGIGAVYGHWYERTADAALRLINEAGGINGRRVEIVVEDDGTDPKRGAELLEKFATMHGCDVVFGALFADVVMGSAPKAAKLKMPYFVMSNGHHVGAGAVNRWTLQPGITDLKSQVTAIAPFVRDRLGRKVTIVFPDDPGGRAHRALFAAAMAELGGEVLEQIAIPTTETRLAAHLQRIPRGTEVLYHVLQGPNMGRFVDALTTVFEGQGPALFGFIDSLEAVDIASPGLEILDGSHFWEGHPRHSQPDQSEYDRFYREAVGVDQRGASLLDARDVSTYTHMYGCWETLYVIKAGMEAASYQSPADRQRLVEAVEAMTDMAESREHPQGPKRFNGKTHQVFGTHHISQVRGGRLDRVHTATIEDGSYPDETDYTALSF